VEWLKDHEGCGPCGVFVFSNIILGIDQKLVQCFRSIQLYGLRCAIPNGEAEILIVMYENVEECKEGNREMGKRRREY